MTSRTFDTVRAVAKPLALARPAAKARLPYIDNLRILLSILVIVHHLAIGYGAAGDWYYNEEGPISLGAAVLMTLFVATNQAFFMGFFFMLASYFSPSSYDRKGAGSFLVDRVKRLGIPIAFYALVINPLLVYALVVREGFQGSLWPFIPLYLKEADSFGVGPLWFAEALLIFSVGYALWRLVTQAGPVPAPSKRDAHAPGNAALALFALASGVATFATRMWLPSGLWVEPFHQELAHYPQYLTLFVAGIIAYRRNWFAALTDAQGRLWRWIAVALLPVFLVIAVVGGALDGNLAPFQGGLHWQSLAYSLWEQFMCVAMVVGLVVWFRNRLNGQGALAQAMSGSAFAVYVFHAPVIVLLAMALSGISLAMPVKFLLVAPVAVSLCFLIGYAIRKLPVARDIL